ncbi:ParB N-terminal domain-containing protein [Zavarzinella formosa]|uniref:hypothetical protein n=1 Tax=Zavarzinella formosa TaxID=360055 RepID=UPI0002EEE6BC|nr:hypothetical protein [Zavarzinella formosa]
MAKKAKPRPASSLPRLRLEYRLPAELVENPRNWRAHPPAQVAALEGLLGEVGWAGALLFNERTGRLIDGHARRAIAIRKPGEAVPVLIGDWSEEDEAKILATLDPVAAAADADQGALASLLADVATDNKAVRELLDSLVEADESTDEEEAANEDEIPERHDVLVICKTEEEQAELLARLDAEGYECRSLIS